ncbi:hypothetical protein H4Q26_006143 [Puccinia striiformis f. sp. tritici PST-130]|nr:hypothetical protein H4Q26_006143 [Puccinia striiformis f. sp. tritici PST-130]
MADGPIQQLNVHPTQGKGRWVVVAALSTIDDNGERPTYQPCKSGIWKWLSLLQSEICGTYTHRIQRIKCHRAIATRKSKPGSIIRHDTVGPKPAQLVRQPPTISSFVIGSRYHDTMSSSGELIMMADELNVTQAPSRPAVSGLEMEDDRPQFRSDASDNPTIHVEYVAKSCGQLPANILKNHSDAITAIVVIDLPFRCIVSADRTGVIHIYECKDRSRYRGDQ